MILSFWAVYWVKLEVIIPRRGRMDRLDELGLLVAVIARR